MGIEQFLYTIKSKKITNPDDNKIYEFIDILETSKLPITHLYIDFYSMNYVSSEDVIGTLNLILLNIIYKKYKLEDNVIGEIRSVYDPIFMKFNIMPTEELLAIKEVETFKKIFTNEVINKIVIEKVIYDIMNIIKWKTDERYLEFIGIYPDGVPAYPKVIEQIRRRYMGSIEGKVKGIIYEECKDKFSEERKEYEKNKIYWSNGNIGGTTSYMTELIEKIKNIPKILGDRYERLREVRVSSKEEYGEGEMKIMNDIKNEKTIGSKSMIMIISPDADAIILSQLVYSWYGEKGIELGGIYVMRASNRNKSIKYRGNHYEIYDVKRMCDNIVEYIKKQFKSEKIIKWRAINDITFILTIFGNDFLPKFITIPIGEYFEAIINTYGERVSMNGKYLIKDGEKNGSNKEINYEFMTEFFYELSKIESYSVKIYEFRQKIYRFGDIYNDFGINPASKDSDESFLKALEIFLTKLQGLRRDIVKFMKKYTNKSSSYFFTPAIVNDIYLNIVKRIKQGNKNKLYESAVQETRLFPPLYNKHAIPRHKAIVKDVTEIINKYTKEEKEFVEVLKKRTTFNKTESINIYELVVRPLKREQEESSKEYYTNEIFMILYMRSFQFNRKIPFEKLIAEHFPSIYFGKNAERTLGNIVWYDIFEKEIIDKGIPDVIQLVQKEKSNIMKLTFENIDKRIWYDIKVFQFEKMLDEYVDILDSRLFELHSYKIDLIKGELIKCDTKSMTEKINQYYVNNFKESELMLKSKYEEGVSKICTEYLTGLKWVFEYYMNDHLQSHTSTWFYRYKLSPLISDLYTFLENNKSKSNEMIRGVNEKLEKENISFDEYFTPDEHTMYISTDMKKVNEETKSMITTVKMPSDIIDIVVKKISEKHNVNGILDGKGTYFLSKCFIHMLIENLPTVREFKASIKRIRNDTNVCQ